MTGKVDCTVECVRLCSWCERLIGLVDARRRRRLSCADCTATLVPGIEEEAAQWRTADSGRYFCPASADALHHPVITA